METPRIEATSGAPAHSAAAPLVGSVDSPEQVAAETEIDAIRKEGLTGRQLRMARRVAQKHGLAVTSDFDAVRQLRAQGIDPFQKSNVLDLIKTGGGSKDAPAALPATAQVSEGSGKTQLPQTIDPMRQLPSTDVRRQQVLDDRAKEIRRMQREIARRRQRNLTLLGLRLAFFILLPTLIAGYYFYTIATPMYETRSEFLIQQAEPPSAAGMGGLFAGTSMATQQDSISVQSYLASRDAMLRLDEEYGFREEFSQPDIDPLQRLSEDATMNEAYKTYSRRVKLSYDPTEGLVRMKVSATSPEQSLVFSEALIDYAEEMVDHMTARLRADQMAGAQENYEKAETARTEALRELTRVQGEVEMLDPLAENGALMGRISTLQGQRDKLEIELAGLKDNPRPNQARVNATTAQIDRVNSQIASLREQITEGENGRMSQTQMSALVREAEENYQARLLLVQESLASMESARVEANRQVRYLSLSVRPVPPDAPTYPRAFENT
ncbi:MAG: capsule biosynthesis protein, partial [Rhodobacterales bacterium]